MTQESRLNRVQINYQAENARFLLECDFSKQYAHYYRKRLEKTRPYLEFNCRSRWDPDISIYTLDELAHYVMNDTLSELGSPISSKRMRRDSDTPLSSEKLSTDCIIIGTIFKRMKLQPDVVQELSHGDFHVKCERYLGHYTSPSDTLVLEDTDESISLIGNINPKHFVTGVVVALLGVPIDGGGQFLVREVCFAEPNRQILYDDISPTPPAGCGELVHVQYLMLLSGLGFHHEMNNKTNLIRALQNLIDFVWGGGDFSNDDRSSQIARILVVGNCLSEDRLKHESNLVSSYDKDDLVTRMKRSRQVKPYEETLCAVNHMDDFFAQLSRTINVDVMPGPTDPSSHLLPQQPFHPCMFPKSCMFPTFNCTTNPHHAIYNDEVELFATSGQNVDIISKFSGISDPIEVMKSHLRWGNCAPSAPDNLYSVPYEDDDPYVIDFIPEIYVAGGQKEFKTAYYYFGQQQNPVLDMSEELAGEPSLDGETTLSGRGTTSQSSMEKTMDEKDRQSSVRTKKDRTLLVSVPQFCDTFSCVLINLQNLDCQLVSFA